MITEDHIATLITAAQRLAAELQRLNHRSKLDIASVIQCVRMLQEPPLTTETPIPELARTAGRVTLAPCPRRDAQRAGGLSNVADGKS